MSQVVGEVDGYDEYDYVIMSETTHDVYMDIESIYKSIVLKR